MRYVFKAYEGPGRYYRNPCDLRNRRRVRDKRGLIAEACLTVLSQGPDCAYGKTYREQQRGNDNYDMNELLGIDAEDTGDENREHGNKSFTEPYLVAEDMVVPAETENITDKVSCEKRDRSDVGPENCGICQEKEPRGKKTVVMTYGFFGKAVDTAGVGILNNHVLQVMADYKNNSHTDNEPEYGTENTGACKICITGNYQRAPSDCRSYRECPYGHGRKALL